MRYTGALVSLTTVLIASPEFLTALKARGDLGQAQTFSDGEALQALDLITRQRPGVVLLERAFAASSRGAALINRIKADPALASCEIRVVAHDPAARVPPRRPEEAAGAAALAVAAPTLPAGPLDRGTRRVPRFQILDGVEVTVDGNPAALVDLSTGGAQVVSTVILRPNQRVRVTLPDPTRLLRMSAAVAWAMFEIPQEGPRYRAGLGFVQADAEALTRFIELHKRS